MTEYPPEAWSGPKVQPRVRSVTRDDRPAAAPRPEPEGVLADRWRKAGFLLVALMCTGVRALTLGGMHGGDKADPPTRRGQIRESRPSANGGPSADAPVWRAGWTVHLYDPDPSRRHMALARTPTSPREGSES